MARFIKAYNEGDSTVFEVAVLALNKTGAKGRGTMWLFGRSPANVVGLEEIKVFQATSDGFAHEYRVMVKVSATKNLKEMLRVNDAIERLDELL